MPPAVMDFFAHQEAANRRSRFLVFNFLLAVGLTILAVYAATTGIFFVGHDDQETSSRFWSLPRFAAVTACTLAIVLAGTLYKIAELAGGGAAVARLLGGRPVPTNAREAPERRALNVVEEMALAAGTPVPPLYVMDEERSINAFAAGYSPRDAVVTVTRGTLESLNREELQAVIGHEFSHILNGDMRLNIRLIGLLNGILLLAIVGRGILRSLGRVRSSSKKGDIRAPIALFSIALIAIGFIGVFFARLIKSAVSRQREYLADASSAQFTRNPLALASALRKIARMGATVSAPHAEEASHLFFANALGSSWLSLLATHPPIEERVRRLDPQNMPANVSWKAHAAAAPDIKAPAAPPATAALGVSAFADRTGAPDSRSMDYADAFLRDTPRQLLDAARNPRQVMPLIVATLLDENPQVRQIQTDLMRGALDAADIEATKQFAELMRTAGSKVRLPLLAIATPTMKTLSLPQFVSFERLTRELIAADRQVDLFEFVLQRTIVRHVESAFRPVHRGQAAAIGWSDARDALANLLSCIAYWGAEDEATARKAFGDAAAELPSSLALGISPIEACGLTEFGSALDKLQSLSFELKRRVINACVACMASDRVATVEEAELLRAVADSLDCPVPPILAGSIEANTKMGVQ